MALRRSVYILQSEADATRFYTGLTSDVAARLTAHNAERCAHTASGRPWRLVVIVEFADEERVAAHAIVCSMSRRGNCHDNAVMESFFSTLKTELREHFDSCGDANMELFDYIEVFYNQRRRHSTIGYVTTYTLNVKTSIPPARRGVGYREEPRQNMRKANLVTILTAAVAVVVAAGGPGHAQAKSSPAPSAVDACTLLTKEEAVSAVGEALDQAKSSGPFPVPMGGIDATVTGCAYESPKSIHGIKLTVHRVPPDKAARFKQFYQGVCARKECVSGVGDMAWWYSGQHSELQVLKNATLLIIKLSRNGDGTEALQTVAKKALGRLP